MNIPDEAVSAAATVMVLGRTPRRGDMEIARAALEAAAPLLMAQAWDEALEAGEHWCRELNPSEIANPYRA